MEQLAVFRANTWWWTPERTTYLLETNAHRALHGIRDFASLYVDRAECKGTGKEVLTSRPLFQQFICTISTLRGNSGQHGPTLTVRVLALTRDVFEVYLVRLGK